MKKFSTGEPIYCHHDSNYKPEYVNQYCWTMDTYSYTFSDKGQFTPGTGGNSELPTRTHKYYQWVPLALFFHVSINALELDFKTVIAADLAVKLFQKN